jgi:hypothetical protein
MALGPKFERVASALAEDAEITVQNIAQAASIRTK